MSGIICYENVDICYNGSPLIKKVSFSAEKGEILQPPDPVPGQDTAERCRY